jgi:flagellar hook-basal body protein
MAKGVYAALSGAVGASVALDVTAQNLANATTAGYQRLRPIFREVLAEQQRQPGQPPAPPSPAANHYSAAQGTVIDLTPGVTRSTGRALDVALPESTFLAVRTGAGERYTRAGSINRTPTGALRLADAELVDEGGKPIVVDPSVDVSATPRTARRSRGFVSSASISPRSFVPRAARSTPRVPNRAKPKPLRASSSLVRSKTRMRRLSTQ